LTADGSERTADDLRHDMLVKHLVSQVITELVRDRNSPSKEPASQGISAGRGSGARPCFSTCRPPGIASYSLDSRSAIIGTTASSAKWIDSTEFVE
jgi:hypothetical protein